MSRMTYIIKTFFLALFLLQLTACAAGIRLSPTQIERGQSTEITVSGSDLHTVQSVEITPSQGVSVREIKEAEPGEKGREKRWSIVVSVEKEAQPGERSVVLVTPKGRSEPMTIRIPSHTLKISDLKVISTQPSPVKVEYVFSVFDEAGDLDFTPNTDTGHNFSRLTCGGGKFYMMLGSLAKKVIANDAKSSTVYGTFAVDTATAQGRVECNLGVQVKDKEGNTSDADTRVVFEGK